MFLSSLVFSLSLAHNDPLVHIVHKNKQDALRAQPQMLQRTTGWDGFPMVFDVLFETPGALLDLFSPNKGTESSNSSISKNSWTTTSFLQEEHGKDEFLQAIKVLDPRFRLFGTFFLIMNMWKDRVSAPTGIFFLKTHL